MDKEKVLAGQRLAYAVRMALRRQGGLSGDTYDGDFIVGVIEEWMKKEESATGVRWVLSASGLRRIIRRSPHERR
jgi:hypothetical protein